MQFEEHEEQNVSPFLNQLAHTLMYSRKYKIFIWLGPGNILIDAPTSWYMLDVLMMNTYRTSSLYHSSWTASKFLHKYICYSTNYDDPRTGSFHVVCGGTMHCYSILLSTHSLWGKALESQCRLISLFCPLFVRLKFVSSTSFLEGRIFIKIWL